MFEPTLTEKSTAKPAGVSIPVSTLRGVLSLVMIASLVSGGAAGAIVTTYLQSDGALVRGEDRELSPRLATVVTVEDSALIDVVEKASQSVVSIIIEKPPRQATGPNLFGFDFGFPGFEIIPQTPVEPEPQTDFDVEEEEAFVQVGAGTGFVVSKDGLILTNKHVVNDADARYSILTKDGKKYEITVLGVDPVNDLAVVKTVDAVQLPALELGSSDVVRIGQTVLAIGNSLGEFENTVTKGVVSGMNRRVTASDGAGSAETLEAVIQTDAAINPGNSGGPLLNIAGQVIGVNTAVSQQGQSIGFAIPINDAIRLIESIEKYGRVIRPYLGVRYILIDKQVQQLNSLSVDHGALLRRGERAEELAVIPGSPADKAGLEENDILLSIDGKEINEQNSLVRILGTYDPGTTVTVRVLKDGDEKDVKIVLGEFETETSTK